MWHECGKIRNTISFPFPLTDSKVSKVPAVTGICDGSQEDIVFFFRATGREMILTQLDTVTIQSFQTSMHG